jgi:branched-chain amino acid transport system permease protein
LRCGDARPCCAADIGIDHKRIQWTAFVIAGTVAGIAGALFAYLKGSVFPETLAIPLSVDALVMVLLGGVETVSGAVVGAIVYGALIWLVSQTDLSKLVLGGFIVLIVVAFPKGIVGMLETIRHRRRAGTEKSAIVTPRIEAAE